MIKKNNLIGSLLLIIALGLILLQSQEITKKENSLYNINIPQVSNNKITLDINNKDNNIINEIIDQKNENISFLENDYINIAFNVNEGSIKNVELKKYLQNQNSSDKYIFNKFNNKPALSLSYLDNNKYLKSYAQDFKIKNHSKNSISFENKTLNGFNLYRKYSISDKDTNDPYIINHETCFINKSSNEINLVNCFIGLGAYPSTKGDVLGEYLNFGYYNGKKADFIKINSFQDSKGFLGFGKKHGLKEIHKNIHPIIWGSVKNQFFTSVLTPYNPANGFYINTTNLSENAYEEGIEGNLEFNLGKIKAKENISLKMDYYVGPKEFTRLDAMGKKQDLIMQFGFFRYISQLLLIVMKWIHSIVPNWGLTIILVTILIKFLLWPLTSIQVRSASQMSKIQEPIKALKEKYKNNPQKLQSETIRLFKENKVNPAAGCLPLLVQLPIFLSLYFMLRTASELRFAKFLWIKDLSVSDTVGYLFDFPVNILPFIMTLSMVWQMKSTPSQTTDNTQKKIFQLMPFIFLIFCYKFPSGLVLYWTVQNFLTILQHKTMGTKNSSN